MRHPAAHQRQQEGSVRPLILMLLAAALLAPFAPGTFAASGQGPAPLVWTDGSDAGPYTRAVDGKLEVRGIAGAAIIVDEAALLTNTGRGPVDLVAEPIGAPGVLAYELRFTRQDGERTVLDLRDGRGVLTLQEGETVRVGVLLSLSAQARPGVLAWTGA